MSWRSRRMWQMTARNATRFAGTKARRLVTPAERRAELDAQFAIRTAEDVAKELGEMKGVLMKVGQLVSFIAEGLPDEAQAALAVAAGRRRADGADARRRGRARPSSAPTPERVFRRWDDLPVAAASIGQVHRAETHGPPRGRRQGAVPRRQRGDRGGPRRRRGDVQRVLGAGAQRPRRPRPRRRAAGPHARGARLPPRGRATSPSSPATSPATRGSASRRSCPSCRSDRVLTTEWIDGMSWDQFAATASHETKQRVGEVIWRFGQHSIQRLGAFNGDPHPGNYRFHHDGSVTFLDFGLVKRWDARRVGAPRAEPRRHRRAPRPGAAGRGDGAVRVPRRRATASTRSTVYDYVSSPYRPYLVDEFTFTRDWMRDTLARIFDLNGPHAEVIAKLNMPPSFVILDRVVWGVSAILGKLEVADPWRAMLLEYRIDAPPATELGAAEAAWRVERP